MPKHWAIWAAVLCLLFGAGFLLSQRTSSGPQGSGKKGRGAGGPIPVSVAKVTTGNMPVYINSLGTVTSVYTVTVTSRVTGELTEIDFKEGQIVHKGQLIAVIDPRPYAATYLQAQGQLERDQAMLENAKIDLGRYQSAYQQHAVPEQQVATQQAAVAQDAGTVKVDQGNLDAAKVNIDYTRITSPINGRVGLRGIDLGNIVTANSGTGIVTITQLQPITVIFTMAEDYLDEVVQQMQHGNKLRVDARSRDDQSELAQGTVLAIDSQIDTTTGTVRVRATFANPNNVLFPNEFVNARLLLKTLMGVNIIPTAAIQRNNDIAFVYAVNANGTVTSHNIKIATSVGDYAAVTGVAPGQTLVTDGFDKLQDGAKVSVRQPRPGVGNSVPNTAGSPEDAGQQPGAPQPGMANTTLNTAEENAQEPHTSEPTRRHKGTSK
ncbi:MAG: efflux RND transporter periplasmic adaptor subunit [Acidobacteriaceae bacterium]|nr:efflux RND transporter periplasmic adaptor subunit [Acidobacteriaceae bacterium]